VITATPDPDGKIFDAAAGAVPALDLIEESGNMTSRLALKLAAIQGELESIPVSGFNKDQNYKYKRVADVVNVTRGAFARHKVLLLWEPLSIDWRVIESRNGVQGREALIWYMATFVDADTGEQKSIRWPGIGIDYADKSLAKAATAALKTFLVTEFQLGDEDDPEADHAQPGGGRRTAEESRKHPSSAASGAITPTEFKGIITHVSRADAGHITGVSDKIDIFFVRINNTYFVAVAERAKKLAGHRGASVTVLAIPRGADKNPKWEIVQIKQLGPPGEFPVTEDPIPAFADALDKRGTRNKTEAEKDPPSTVQLDDHGRVRTEPVDPLPPHQKRPGGQDPKQPTGEELFADAHPTRLERFLKST